MSIEMKAADFMKYLEETKSPSTLKLYRIGLTLFREYYGKSLDQILEERKNDLASGDAIRRKRFLREIEKFHSWLQKEKNKPLNSATTYTNGILQLLRYFEMGVTIPSSSMVGKRKQSTKDFVPTVEQYRAMFRVADNLRDKVVISLGKDLGARIGDFVKIRKDMLPNLDQEAPISFDLMTEKEDVLAKSFISEETVQLLKQYLPSLPEHNPYLFPSSNGSKSHLGEEAINRGLRKLARKAKIVVPKRKRLRFHAFRKRFLSECANANLPITTAKVLVGKSVSTDMLTYLSEVEHKKAFEEVHNKLRLTEVKAMVNAKDAEIEALKKENQELRIQLKGVLEYLRKTEDEQKEVLQKYSTPKEYATYVRNLGEEAIRKQDEEYKKLIEENNNNNNH